MIHVFDLDDTLYEERLFVESGFRAVAKLGQELFGWCRVASFQFMIERLDQDGRGAVFNNWLSAHGKYSHKLLRKCVFTYRYHPPEINLYESAQRLLNHLSGQPLYIVTDGHKSVQAGKVRALGIQYLFKRVYITHRYGRKHAKPSLYCFELIRNAENCSWNRIVYIGDDPQKDFVSLKKAGAHTVRVHTGRHRDMRVHPSYDADYHMASLDGYIDLMNKLEQSF